MKVSATVKNAAGSHQVAVATAGAAKSLEIPGKPDPGGSDVNGGELLMLALATCYCNDIYREASRLGIAVDAVEVEATADFQGVGLAATNIQYRAAVSSPADKRAVERLLRETDAVAEVHNTVRAGVPVRLVSWESRS